MKRARRRPTALSRRISKILLDTVRRSSRDKAVIKPIARELLDMEKICSAGRP